jgi:phospholipase/carboxylesterase
MSRVEEGRAARISRRGALLAAATGFGCPSRSRAPVQTATPPATTSGAESKPDWGGLEMETVGRMREDERGGTAMVLLHGWGAPGDDLVPLARALARDKTRFFLPAGPLPEMGGGRAWWHLDARDRPAHAWDDQEAAGHQPHRQVGEARAAIQKVLTTIQARYRPEALFLGGFSQGAMLSLDVALAAAPAVHKVVALSGVMLADSLAGLKATRPDRPAVFVSHGRQDSILPFTAGDKARQLLERHGFAVTWRPFDGGHEIPPPIVEEARRFLFG